jgi:hypothetical protein
MIAASDDRRSPTVVRTETRGGPNAPVPTKPASTWRLRFLTWREAVLELVEWFRRRYPTPLARLAYARKAYARWQGPTQP